MKKLPSSIYMPISYDDLLVCALYEISNSQQAPTFENLVAKCFRLFPKRFQLPGYSTWPDASLVEKSWLRCRADKGLIYGSKSKGFTLTPKGLELALQVYQKLQGKKLTKVLLQRKGDARTKSGRLVRHVEQAPAFQKFIQRGDISQLTEFEFCDLIYSTLDTKPSLRKKNIKELKYHAGIYGRNDIINFLKECEKKFSTLLVSPEGKYYQGGMMRKKK